MTDPLIWIVLGFFIIVSVLDLKFKAVPSVLMTGMLFIVAYINIANLNFGVMALILAILLQEFDTYRGIADTKATIIIGFMIATYQMLIIYIILLVVFQLVYTMVIKMTFLKVEKFPFLPVYLIVYALLLLGGYVIPMF